VRSQEYLLPLTSLFLVKAESATGCAKHANVKAEVAAKKTEVATGNVNNNRLFSEVYCLIFVSAIAPNEHNIQTKYKFYRT
jgi:hypothetical protein